MGKSNVGFVLVTLLLVSSMFFPSLQSVHADGPIVISNSPTGGDCSEIGTWDLASSTCTLFNGDIEDNMQINSGSIVLIPTGTVVTFGGSSINIHGDMIIDGKIIFDNNDIAPNKIAVLIFFGGTFNYRCSPLPNGLGTTWSQTIIGGTFLDGDCPTGNTVTIDGDEIFIPFGNTEEIPFGQQVVIINELEVKGTIDNFGIVSNEGLVVLNQTGILQNTGIWTNQCDNFPTRGINEIDGGAVFGVPVIDASCLAPVAVNDFYTVNEDTTLVVPNISDNGVLFNDSDGDTDQSLLTVTVTVQPTSGILSLLPDGSFTYTPILDFSGVDTFSYDLDDGTGGHDDGLVTINVNPGNDPPTANPDNIQVNEDSNDYDITSLVLSNDTDPDNDILTVISADDSDTAIGEVTVGSLIYNPNGQFENLAKGVTAIDTFDYTIADVDNLQSISTVTVTIIGQNDQPTPQDDNYSLDQATSLVVSSPGLLANDVDIDGDSLIITDVIDGPSSGTFDFSSNGAFVYTPNPTFFGTDTIRYVASDGIDDVAAFATFTIIDVIAPVITVDPLDVNVIQDSISPDLLDGVETDDGSPITITGSVDTSTLGEYEIRYDSTDANNNDAEPAFRTYHVIDITDPEVPTIDPPTNNPTNNPSQIISGTAEPGSTVELSINGNPITPTVIADSNGDWSLPITLSEGSNIITATATDPSGNTSDPSTPITITLDTIIPDAPTIDPPTNNPTNNPSQIISGIAEPNSTVKVFVNGVSQGTVIADSVTGIWTSMITLIIQGDNNVTAITTDSSNNTSDPSTPITITLDTIIPDAPIIGSPTDGTSTNNPSQTVSGTAEPGSTVELSINGNPITPTVIADSNGDWSLPITLSEGVNTITSTASDEVNTSDPSTPITITLDTIIPDAPIIGSPTDGTSTNNPSQTVSGTAEPNSTVEVFVNGVSQGTTSTDSNGDWSLPITLSEGVNTITSTASDEVNTSDPSTPITITLDTTIPPSPPIIGSPTDGTSTNNPSQTVSGTAEPNSTVEVFVNGVSQGTTSTDSNGDWSLPITLSEGVNTITSTVTDINGNTSDESTPITVTLLDSLLQQKLALITQLENLIDSAENDKTIKELEKAIKDLRKGADSKYYTEDENSFLDSKSAHKALKYDKKGIKHIVKILHKQYESAPFNIELGQILVDYLKIDKQLIINTYLNHNSRKGHSLDHFMKSLRHVGVETDSEFIDDSLSEYNYNLIENYGKSWKEIQKEKRDSGEKKEKISWKQFVEKLKSEGKWGKKSGSDDNQSGSDDNQSGSDDNQSGSDDNQSGSDDNQSKNKVKKSWGEIKKEIKAENPGKSFSKILKQFKADYSGKSWKEIKNILIEKYNQSGSDDNQSGSDDNQSGSDDNQSKNKVKKSWGEIIKEIKSDYDGKSWSKILKQLKADNQGKSWKEIKNILIERYS